MGKCVTGSKDSIARQLLLTLAVDGSRTKRHRIMEKKGPRNSIFSGFNGKTLENGTTISDIKFSLDGQEWQFSATQKKHDLYFNYYSVWFCNGIVVLRHFSSRDLSPLWYLLCTHFSFPYTKSKYRKNVC